MTHHFLRAGGVLALAALCGAAQAQVAGTISVRAGFTRLAPVTDSGNLSAPSFPGTKVEVRGDNSLTGGINYMLTDNWAVDVPLGLPFKHDIDGAGAISGVGKLGSIKILPVTVFGQYRFGEAQARFRPYVGVGVVYGRFFKSRSTQALTAILGGTPTAPVFSSSANRFGWAMQVGGEWDFNERWFLNVGYYKAFLRTTSYMTSGQYINVKLNPNVYTFGIGYRF